MAPRQDGEMIKAAAVITGLIAIYNFAFLVDDIKAPPSLVLVTFEIIYVCALILTTLNLATRKLFWPITLSGLVAYLTDGVFIIGTLGGHPGWRPMLSDDPLIILDAVAILLKVPFAILMWLAISEEMRIRKKNREPAS